MKTKDITKLGIDRNFIRECERKGLIVPVRSEGRMIVNDKYFPREYSDADLKIIWQSYLFRKMGMPFSEIKRYFSGEQVDVRDCINDNIERLENQIEECEATIRFMKYVRGEGVSLLPRLPQKTSKASNFTEFINEYIQFIDPNKKRLEFLDHVHSELELNKTPVETMTLTQVLKKNENKKYFEDYAKNIYENDAYLNELKEIDKIIDAIENLVLLKNKNVDFKSDDAIAEFR
jgi:DNA-binding transcriptional MerR regulator